MKTVGLTLTLATLSPSPSPSQKDSDCIISPDFNKTNTHQFHFFFQNRNHGSNQCPQRLWQSDSPRTPTRRSAPAAVQTKLQNPQPQISPPHHRHLRPRPDHSPHRIDHRSLHLQLHRQEIAQFGRRNQHRLQRNSLP